MKYSALVGFFPEWKPLFSFCHPRNELIIYCLYTIHRVTKNIPDGSVYFIETSFKNLHAIASKPWVLMGGVCPIVSNVALHSSNFSFKISPSIHAILLYWIIVRFVRWYCNFLNFLISKIYERCLRNLS